jgi:hypothetical protein
LKSHSHFNVRSRGKASCNAAWNLAHKHSSLRQRATASIASIAPTVTMDYDYDDLNSVASYDEPYWKACHPTGCCGPDEGCGCHDTYDHRDDISYDTDDRSTDDRGDDICNCEISAPPPQQVTKRSRFNFVKSPPSKVEMWFAERQRLWLQKH